MIDTRLIAILGVGYTPYQMATDGLLDILTSQLSVKRLVARGKALLELTGVYSPFNNPVGTLITAIAYYLEAMGLGTVGQKIFIGRNTLEAPEYITLVQTGGDIRLPQNKTEKNVRFQVLIGSPDYLYGATLAERVFSLLHDKFNFVTLVKGRCTANHLPGPNWTGELDTVVFTLNFQFAAVF